MSVNKVILIGNLGKDPEVKNLDGGNKVASFSLATSESYKDKNGERQKNTEWHNLVVWGKLADVVEKYLKKGNQVYIEGKIKTRSWTDKEEVKRYTTEIVVSSLTMLGSGKKEEQQTQASNDGVKSDQSGVSVDDLPF